MRLCSFDFGTSFLYSLIHEEVKSALPGLTWLIVKIKVWMTRPRSAYSPPQLSRTLLYVGFGAQAHLALSQTMLPELQRKWFLGYLGNSVFRKLKKIGSVKFCLKLSIDTSCHCGPDESKKRGPFRARCGARRLWNLSWGWKTIITATIVWLDLTNTVKILTSVIFMSMIRPQFR